MIVKLQKQRLLVKLICCIAAVQMEVAEVILQLGRKANTNRKSWTDLIESTTSDNQQYEIPGSILVYEYL